MSLLEQVRYKVMRLCTWCGRDPRAQLRMLLRIPALIKIGKIGRVPFSPHTRSAQAQEAGILSDRACFTLMLMFYFTVTYGRPRPFGLR